MSSASDAKQNGSPFYTFKMKDFARNEFDFAQLQGKVVLCVNVASKCGYTKQYSGLENLYLKYKDQGFMMLGFPCNQFGNQEPGSEEEIKDFCTRNYNVTFPVMQKIEVLGISFPCIHICLFLATSALSGER